MLLVIPCAAAGKQEQAIFDNGGFLSADAEANLTRLALEKAENTGCAFYVATHKMRFEGDEYWGEDFLRDQRLSEKDNIILLIITKDGSTYYYDLYLYGDAEDRLPRREREYLLDYEDVYDNIKSGRLQEGIIDFLNESAALYEGETAGYKEYLKAFYLKIFLLSFAVAAVFGFVACFSVYKSYAAKQKSVDYPLEHFAKMDLKDRDDVFAGSFVTRRVIQSNNGKSGGGGGRGGGRGHAGGR